MAKEEELYAAVVNGDMETIRRLRDERIAGLEINVNHCFHQRFSLTQSGEFIMDDAGIINDNCLLQACRTNNTEAYDLLMSMGGHGIKLELACSFGHADMIRHLLDNYPDTLNELENLNNLLGIACIYGQLEIVREVLKRDGTNINAELYGRSWPLSFKNGSTPLVEAIEGNHTDVVDFLLTLPAIQETIRNNVSCCSIYSFIGNIFMFAITKLRYDIIDRLLASSLITDINYQNRFGHTALHKICVKKADSANHSIIDKLIVYCIDINRPTKRGITALMYALSMENIPVIEKLVNAGANTNIANFDGKFTLEYAKSKEAIQLLLDHGADYSLLEEEKLQRLEKLYGDELPDKSSFRPG